MTVIVGVKTDGGVLLGADSASGVYDTMMRSDPKLVQVDGSFAFGFTTSYRFGQIVRFHVERPLAKSKDLFDLLVSDWVPRLRRALREHGYTEAKDGRETAGELVVAWRDRLFKVHSDFSVAESPDRFLAAGCGEDFALGALEVLLAHGCAACLRTPRELLNAALAVAESRSGPVRGPFVYAETRT